MKRIHRCILTRVIIPGHGERDSGEEELPTPQRLTHLLDSWAPGSSLLWIRGTLSLALLPLGSGTQHQDLSKRGKCWGDIRQRGEMTVSKPLRRSWMCNCPPQVQWPSHQAPSWPAGCWHRGNQWQGPSGPPWPSPPPDTLMLTAYSSGKGEHNCRSTTLTVPAYACACVCVSCHQSARTSRCLVASSLRDMSISFVRMLRKCMSLRIVARFTVVSFVDCKENKTRIRCKHLNVIVYTETRI